MSTVGNNDPDSSSKDKGWLSAFHQKWLLICVVLYAFLSIILVGLYALLYRGPVELARGLRQETTAAGTDAVQFARGLAGDIAKFLQFTPQVTVNGMTVVEANRSILELATVERKSQTRYKWEHSWMGSTKTLELEAFVRVKAGFDLKQPFTIAIDTQQSTVTALMPPAKVLSVEMISYKVIEDKNGWWNKVTADDREQALQALMRQARQTVAGTDILQEADRSFRERLAGLVADKDKKMRFIYRMPGE